MPKIYVAHESGSTISAQPQPCILLEDALSTVVLLKPFAQWVHTQSHWYKNKTQYDEEYGVTTTTKGTKCNPIRNLRVGYEVEASLW